MTLLHLLNLLLLLHLLPLQVAAQNCRRRKLEQIVELEAEVEAVRSRRQRLVAERDQLEERRRGVERRLEHLQHFLKSSLEVEGVQVTER